MLKPTKAMAEAHYADLSTKPFFNGLTDFFSSGPIVAMVVEGQGVIKGTRHLLGATNPADAPAGSIRNKYCVVTGRNIIHASDGVESAAHEIQHWFGPGAPAAEVVDWTPASAVWVYEK
jgi:nucleoside-diphosphate kinase